LVRRRAGADAVQDIVLFFERRRAWDRKDYAQFSRDDVEALQTAKQRYTSPEIETLYSSWALGELDDGLLRPVLAVKYASANAGFRTYLLRSAGDLRSKKSAAPRSEPPAGASSPTPASTSTLGRTKVAETPGDRD